MLKRLRFSNFKSWAEAEFDLAPVTALFGPNSSGKTSIIQFLLLLKQTKESSDRAIALELNGDHVQLGTYGDVVHKHDEQRELEFRMEWTQEITIFDPAGKQKTELAKAGSIVLEATIQSVKGAPHARSLRYHVGEAKFRLARSSESGPYELTVEGLAQFRFKRAPGRPWHLPGPVKTYGFPDQVRTYFQNTGFLSDLEASFEKLMDCLFYLGPLREYPHRDYLWARSRPSDVGSRGEKAIDAILAATEAKWKRNVVRKGKLLAFQEMISLWLREMGLIESFVVEEISTGSNRWQARLRVREGSPEVLLADVGFGVSQVLPVITLLYYVPEGSIVILEQPEIHLHPLAQAHLADLVISAAQRRKVQVIVESHSEHFLLRLQRRIAEGKIKANEVQMYFCDLENGGSRLTRLEVDLLGNIKNWPRNFMGDQFGEVAKAELARLRRVEGEGQAKAAE